MYDFARAALQNTAHGGGLKYQKFICHRSRLEVCYGDVPRFGSSSLWLADGRLPPESSRHLARGFSSLASFPLLRRTAILLG